MITIKEITIDIESGSKIINLIKKHEPEIWKVLKIELKEALTIPIVVVPKGTLCANLDKNNNCRMSCLTRCVEGNKFWK
tara:strand:+ start:1469 stop:1705 length:237 start_codon:yes stop_codon:yes gene_type:complete